MVTSVLVFLSCSHDSIQPFRFLRQSPAGWQNFSTDANKMPIKTLMADYRLSKSRVYRYLN